MSNLLIFLYQREWQSLDLIDWIRLTLSAAIGGFIGIHNIMLFGKISGGSLCKTRVR